MTGWQPITCIFILIKRNSRNKLEVLLDIWSLYKILTILKNKIIFIASIFLKLSIPENVVTYMP